MRELPHDGVREGNCALETRRTHELDGVVDDGMVGLIGERELVRAEPQSRPHRRVELAHRPLAELLDPEVERPCHLHRPVGEPLRERPVAGVEAVDGGGEGPVCVSLFLEDAAHDVVRSLARRSDHLAPRKNSS